MFPTTRPRRFHGRKSHAAEKNEKEQTNRYDRGPVKEIISDDGPPSEDNGFLFRCLPEGSSLIVVGAAVLAFFHRLPTPGVVEAERDPFIPLSGLSARMVWRSHSTYPAMTSHSQIRVSLNAVRLSRCRHCALDRIASIRPLRERPHDSFIRSCLPGFSSRSGLASSPSTSPARAGPGRPPPAFAGSSVPC